MDARRLTPPDLLNHPLCEARRFQTRDQVTQPLSLLRPTIDGLVTNFFEWRGAGTINPNPPLGAMWKAEGLFSAICLASIWSTSFSGSIPQSFLSQKADLPIECWLQTPGHSYRLEMSLASPIIMSCQSGGTTAAGRR